jgi:hypothetical protein
MSQEWRRRDALAPVLTTGLQPWRGRPRPTRAAASKGLVVIGAHTPEFNFEQDADDVRREATGVRVTYPIAIDNDYAM